MIRYFLPLTIVGVVLLTQTDFLKQINTLSPLPKMSELPVASRVPQINELEQSVFQRVNEYRASQNLPPLQLDPRISQQCKLHSQSMAQGEVEFSHAGSKQRFQAIAQEIPYRMIAENVAYNSGYVDPGIEAVKGWIESDGHRQNMEGDFNLTGIGIARNPKGEYYFTQIFVRSR